MKQTHVKSKTRLGKVSVDNGSTISINIRRKRFSGTLIRANYQFSVKRSVI